MPEKENIIKQVYYDADTGFGSIQDTYKQATRILKTITITLFHLSNPAF